MWNAQTREAQMVLEGTYDSTDETEIQKIFLEHLKRVTPTDKFNERVTIRDFKKAMQKWKERTSTSPSGRHLGHYKVCVCQIDRKLNPAQKTKLRRLRDQIADIYVTMINYATKHNYSFNRWKTIINMMIYKEANNSFINRLRVIHIYEADLAYLLGTKWNEALNHAIDNKPFQ